MTRAEAQRPPGPIRLSKNDLPGALGELNAQLRTVGCIEGSRRAQGDETVLQAAAPDTKEHRCFPKEYGGK